jgi:poly(3-hydroxybutyrate) depolymerase
MQAPYVVTLPNGYAASTPSPLVFGFHGRNRTHTQFQTVDASGIQQQLGSQAVMAYLKSQGGTGWEGGAELSLNVEFFEVVLDTMLAGYSIDTSRIFVVGHSSGAHFANILACRYGNTLRGVGAVAGILPEQNCVENVAAIIIHGATDNQVPNTSGRAARDFYVNRNGCTMTTAPGSVSPCVAYQGCDAGLPVEWCEHTEPTYDNTNHGWPSFASEAIAELFWSLP